MIPQLRGYHEDAGIHRFTALANKKPGDVIVEQGRVGVVCGGPSLRNGNVLSGEEGLAIFATDSKGVLMPKATGAIARHQKLYWDEDGNPIDGVAGSGALTTTSTNNLYVGRAAEAAASGDAQVAAELTNQ